MSAPSLHRPLLVVAASTMEWRGWRKGLGVCRLPVGQPARVQGRPHLALLRTGIGLEAAAASTAAIEELRPAVVLHVGFAGALRPGLGAGDLLLVSATSPEVCDPGTAPLPAPTPADAGLFDALLPPLARLPGRFAQGPLLTVDRFVHRADDKVGLGKAGPYLACEMEARAVRAAADRAGAAYAGLRAISDSSDHDLPPPIRGAGGRLDLGRALGWSLRPAARRDLVRLLSGGRRGWQTLGRALPVAVDVLLGEVG